MKKCFLEKIAICWAQLLNGPWDPRLLFLMCHSNIFLLTDSSRMSGKGKKELAHTLPLTGVNPRTCQHCCQTCQNAARAGMEQTLPPLEQGVGAAPAISGFTRVPAWGQPSRMHQPTVPGRCRASAMGETLSRAPGKPRSSGFAVDCPQLDGLYSPVGNWSGAASEVPNPDPLEHLRGCYKRRMQVRVESHHAQTRGWETCTRNWWRAVILPTFLFFFIQDGHLGTLGGKTRVYSLGRHSGQSLMVWVH